jgi:hypothetical protein
MKKQNILRHKKRLIIVEIATQFAKVYRTIQRHNFFLLLRYDSVRLFTAIIHIGKNTGS